MLSKNQFFTFRNIPMDRWIRATEGDLSALSKSNKMTNKSQEQWFKLQDEYVLFFGGDSREMKRYKRVLVDYHNALADWIQEPQMTGKLFMQVNLLFEEKNELQNKIYDDNEQNFGELVARASISAGYHIDTKNITALQFFNIIKALGDGYGKNI